MIALNQSALDHLLADIQATDGGLLACSPTSITITRDQVVKYGSADALAEWDARFPHNRVFAQQGAD